MVHATPVLVSDQSLESDHLESERVKLLNSIYKLSEDASQPEKQEEIKSLRSDYNQIISRQVMVNRGPWTDPLSILPLEIWVHIIEEILDNRWGSSYRVIANMVLVGQKWKEAIVNTPQFWTVITIDPNFQESDLLERVAASLHLSKDHPLTLLLDFPIDRASYDACQTLISPHSSRIRRIHFRNPSKPIKGSKHLDPSVYQVLSDFLPLPNLQEIQFGNFCLASEEQWDIVELMPQLKFVEGDGMPLSVLRRISLVHLESLKTYGSVDKLFTVIANLPQIKELEMAESSYTNWAVDDSCEVPAGDSVTPEQPLSLETMTWHRYNGSRLKDLIHWSPCLKSMTLLVSWKFLVSVLEEMANLPFLSYLAVYVQRKASEDKFSPAAVTQSPSLRELHFEVGYFGSDNDSKERRELNKNLSNFVDAWLPTFARLEKAFICLGNEWPLPLALLPNLRRVKVLSLTLSTLNILGEFPKLPFDALEDLKLHIPASCYVDFLSFLQCPNLLLLTVQTSTSPYSEKVSIHLDPKQFPRLSGLHWNTKQLAWTISSHRMLKLIVFGRGGSQAASNFCTHLILRPLDFPSLEQVEFYEFPEWDLITLMLERRNFLLEPSISRIRTVVLPTTLGFILKTPLTSLLGGQFSNRLSNHDLSIAGIAEVYFDKSLSGCHWCCLSMQACSSYTYPAYYAPSMQAHWSNHQAEPITVTPDPPLADSTLNWLEQRQERYSQWKQNADAATTWTRGSVCESHQLSSLFVFSSFSTANPSTYRSVAVETLKPVFD
ncbi:hypothetical protein FRC14_004825 [Serendipita sp. 396]|nr:hypothetical protein FRC14_004825 [Serendipita sp. 396]KAG8868873.1 hypothetical protein FRC20_002646 [Serendipita sp. 405]